MYYYLVRSAHCRYSVLRSIIRARASRVGVFMIRAAGQDAVFIAWDHRGRLSGGLGRAANHGPLGHSIGSMIERDSLIQCKE